MNIIVKGFALWARPAPKRSCFLRGHPEYLRAVILNLFQGLVYAVTLNLFQGLAVSGS